MDVIVMERNQDYMHLVEGLILNKIPYKEQDLIVSILQRNGKKLSLIAGGSRTLRGNRNRSAIELGFMVQFMTSSSSSSRSNSRSLLYSREWSLKWYPRQVRHHPDAFFLLSFFLESLEALSPEGPHSPDEESSHFSGMFSIASNCLFYLEDSLAKKSFSSKLQLFFFLTKLVQEMGLYPQLSHCLRCKNQINEGRPRFIHFVQEDGGFLCADCGRGFAGAIENENENEDEDHLYLWSLLVLCSQRKYADYDSLPLPSEKNLSEWVRYFLYHTHFRPRSLKNCIQYASASHPHLHTQKSLS